MRLVCLPTFVAIGRQNFNAYQLIEINLLHKPRKKTVALARKNRLCRDRNSTQVEFFPAKTDTRQEARFSFLIDSSRWDQDFFGVPCFGMDELTALPKSSILIITVRDYQEIAAALAQNNFENIYLSFFERAEWRLKEIRHLGEFNSKLTHVDPRISELSNKTCYVSGATGGVGTQVLCTWQKQDLRFFFMADPKSPEIVWQSR